MVFKKAYAQAYDALYEAKDYVNECDLIEAAFQKLNANPRTILDVGCGTGGHVFELAKRAYDCTGVDLSSDMISIAQQKAANLNYRHTPILLQGNATTFELDRTFDAAVMMFAVVGYLTENDDVIAALKNLRKHLHRGAPFICDFWYGPAVLSNRPADRVKVIHTGQGKTIRASSTSLDTFSQTADVSFKLWSFENESYLGETVETHKMRYFFAQEFCAFLRQAGFAPVLLAEFPTLDKPLDDGSWNAICVARAE